MDIMQLVWVVVSAAVFAVSGYLKSVGEKPDPVKLAATMLVGALVGLAFTFTGAPVSEEAVGAMLLTYVGAVVLIEYWLKAIVRRVQAWCKKTASVS